MPNVEGSSIHTAIPLETEYVAPIPDTRRPVQKRIITSESTRYSAVTGRKGPTLESDHIHAQEARLRKELHTLKTLIKVDSVKTMDTSMALAEVLRLQGEYGTAEKILNVLLHECQEEYGEANGYTIEARTELALVLMDRGQYTKAEKMLRDNFYQLKALKQLTSPSGMACISTLALVFDRQKCWDVAIEVRIQFIDMSRILYGSQDPLTLRSISHLARSFLEQGRFDEAEKLVIPTLESQNVILGPNHADTVRTMIWMSLIYLGQKRFGRAETLLSQAFETRKRLLGEQHPDTLFIMHNMARILKAQGRKEDAVDMMRRCVLARKTFLGEDHPDTRGSIMALSMWTAVPILIE
jgi:tetratricopeptide (TPR) repeat protein